LLLLLLLLGLRVLLSRRNRWLMLLWLGWMLALGWHSEDCWVLADVLDEGLERLMAEESLDQAAVAFVLLHQSSVFLSESVAFLCLYCDLAFKLRDIF
jgi:hypothetical protein